MRIELDFRVGRSNKIVLTKNSALLWCRLTENRECKGTWRKTVSERAGSPGIGIPEPCGSLTLPPFSEMPGHQLSPLMSVLFLRGKLCANS